jgi:hypothetical protein
MNYGSVLGITFSIIGFLLSWQGLWLICRAIWPERVKRAADRCRTHRVGSFFLGLPITLAVVLLALVIGKRGGTPGQIVAWIIAGIFLMYAGTGMSGFVTFIGERLGSPADAARPWRATIRGGIAFELACLIPFIGWIGLLGSALILGAGAVTLSFFVSPRQDLQATLQANRNRATESHLAELPPLEPAGTGV